MGWNGSTGTKDASSTAAHRQPSAASQRRPSYRMLFVGIIALIVCGITVWRLAGNKPKQSITKTNGLTVERITEVKPEIVTNKTSMTDRVVEDRPKRETWNGHEIASKTVTTNGMRIMTRMVGTDGKIYIQMSNTDAAKPIFSNPVDQVLCTLLTTPPGASIPPVPPLGPHAADIFAKALKTPIEIAESDSEEVKQKKRIVQAAREDMYEELCRGKTVEQVIDDYCTTVNENNKLRAEAKAEYRRLYEEDGEEMAEQYREKANALLEKNGIEKVNKRGENRRRNKELPL